MRLSALRLTVEHGGRTIFSNLSFALDAGENLIVTGPNGAGKSTLLRPLAGLLPLAAGTMPLPPASGETLAEHVHYVGHADALKGLLTAIENLDFIAAILGAGLGGVPAAKALAEFGLSHAADLP